MQNALHTANGTGTSTVASEKLESKKGVAEHCAVTTRTIDEWMKEGRIPYFKIGRTVRFRLSDVDAYLNATCLVARRKAVR